MGRMTLKAPLDTVISDRTWLSQQSWHRERIVKTGAYTIRYHVRCNAYDFQSYADAEVWRDNKWSQVHRIRGEQMRTKAPYVRPDVTPDAFDEDLIELRRVAVAVLGVF